MVTQDKISCLKNFNEFDFYDAFTESDIGMIILDSEGLLLNWNPWVNKYSRKAFEDVLSKKLIDIFPSLKGSRLDRAIDTALKYKVTSFISDHLNKKPFPFVNRVGYRINQQITVKHIVSDDLQHYCLIQILDVTAAVTREKQLIDQAKKTKEISIKLSQEKQRAQVTLDSIADAVITTDEKGIILSMNLVAEVLIGIDEHSAKGQKVNQVFKLIYEKNRDAVLCPVQQCLESRETLVNDDDYILLGGNNKFFSITESVAPIIDGDKLLGAILVFRDVTRSRALSAELNWQALHDPLTGLANRRKFENELSDLLEKSKEKQSRHYLLYLDLDQFKVVNDTCGHHAGDELLKQITSTLEGKIRGNDLLARLGGDEFGVLLEGCNEENALLIANKLRQAVEDFRFSWQTQSFKIGVSIGIAAITGDAIKASEILSAADTACYSAKESGRNRVHIHTLNVSHSAARQKEMRWIVRLQAALDNNRFELYLQRIQSLQTLECESNHYEVLLRMVGEEGQMIPPGAFLPAAERFNMVESLDLWVVENVFKNVNLLKKNMKISGEFMLAINLSGGSMANNRLLNRICELLDYSQVPAGSFCFEVTETATITNLSQATDFLSKLREKGCKIALDDFGSGLSSFAYLKELPVDLLKIDGHFVKDIVVDDIDEAFVRSINQIGQVMGLKTIAEFVETPDILRLLTEIGVDYAQGYGVHKPTPFSDVFDLSLP